jgi:Zn-dependent protease/CBS domain-containing protein
VAATTVVLFFACVLGHELAHAIVAQRNGVTVEGITLWLIGGVAKFAGDPPTARADMRIAAVGPAASVVIGLGWFAVGGVLDAVDGSTLIVGAIYWLATINIALAVFNILPAFPLDGGRVFRAALWDHHGDHLRTTRTAAFVGRGFVLLFVAAGALLLANDLLINAVWLWLIAWFLHGASNAELQYATTYAVYGGLHVAEVMTADPMTIHADTPVATAIDDIVLRHRWSSYPVVDDSGRAVGLLTLDNLRHVAPAERDTTTVGNACLAMDAVATTTRDEDATVAFERMAHFVPNRLLVLDAEQRPEGIVSISDIARGLEIGRLAAT